MRSTKIKIGVACAVGSLLAVLVMAVSIGAGTDGRPSIVGSGNASATKSVCGKGTGKKATGTPIKLGGIDMLIPGVDFTTIGKVANAYFKCVNDNGGINGRPIQLHPLHRAAQPGAGGRARPEADRERQGRRRRRQHELRRVRDELRSTTRARASSSSARASRPSASARRRSPRRTWGRATATSAPRRRSIRAGVKKLAIASPDTISAYADGGRGQARRRRRPASRSRSSRRTCRSRTRPRS